MNRGAGPAARVGRNAARLFLGRILAQALLAGGTVLLAARLGVEGLGRYAFVAAVVFVANVATTFGTDMVLIREIAGARRLRLWPAALVAQTGLSVAAVAAVWLAAPLVPGIGAGTVEALRILSLTLGPSAVFNVCTAVLRGTGRIGAHAALGVVAAGVQLAAVGAFVGAGADLARVAVVLLAVQAAVAVLAVSWCVAGVPGFASVPAPSRRDVAETARAAGRVGLLGALGVAYQRVPVVALAVLAGPVATGWFTAALRVSEASESGHVALLGALYPALAESGGELATSANRRDGRRVSWLAVSLLGGSAVSGALLVLAPMAIGVLYGPAFAPSAGGLAILGASIVPSTLANFLSVELLAAHGEARTLRAQLASLGVLVALLAVGVPAIGWIGGAWAVLAAESVQAGLLLHATGRLRPWRRQAWRPGRSTTPSLERSAGAPEPVG